MRIGLIMWDVDEEKLQFARQLGVSDILVSVRDVQKRDYISFEKTLALRTRIEASGLRFTAIHGIPSGWYNKIRYGLSGKDRQIDNFERSIRNIGSAGVPIWGYQFHSVRVWRTSSHTRARGDALVTSYDHSLMENAPTAGRRPVTDEEMLGNFQSLLQRIIPVAEVAGVKMALHPDDPPMSPIAGAACPFRSIETFQRVVDMVPSESNGMIFCQGCFTEMGSDVYEAIRQFGAQKKIFYVHFRNVKGTVPAFRESFIDNGDVDMVKAMKTYKDVGYDGLFVPDHLPVLVGDSKYQHRSRSYVVGYIRALIQSVEAE